MADGKSQSRKRESGHQVKQKPSGRSESSSGGAWKAAALDRYMIVRPSDTDAGAVARVLR